MDINNLRTKELSAAWQSRIELACKSVGALFFIAALGLAGWAIISEMFLREGNIPQEAGFFAFIVFALMGAGFIAAILYGLGFYFRGGRKAAWFTTAALALLMLATHYFLGVAIALLILVITAPGTWWNGIRIGIEAGTGPQQPDPSTSVDSLDENA